MLKQFPNRKIVLFFVFACAVLCASLGFSLYLLWSSASNAQGDSVESAESRRYQHATFTDARYACENRARREFGDRLWVLSVDQRSSRLDRQENLFKIFMEADLFPTAARQAPARRFFVNCFTSMDNARVMIFQYSVDGHEFGEESDGRGLLGL